VPRKSELERALAAFPFTKLHPQSFRVEIASLNERELEKRPVRIWVETEDISKVVKTAGAARVIRTYPHLNLVYLEAYASQLASLVRSELVRSVWNDLPVKADGCIVVTAADSGAFSLAHGINRRAC
jgi:hypothetical protein